MSNFLDQFTEYKLPAFENGVRLPEILISPQERAAVGAKKDSSNKDYLKLLCWKALKDKIASGKIKQTKEDCVARLKIEFEVYELTGIVDYLLLLYEIMSWCDANGIIRGPGRGSACGSLALYLINVTRVNPLDHNLNFTRFISAVRAKPHYIDGILYLDGKNMPDVDCDISFLGRPKLVRHLEERFAGRVAKISTSQYLTGKMALKDTLKSCYGYHDADARAVTDNIEAVFGKVKPLNEAYEDNKAFKSWADENKEKLVIGQAIEGLYRTKGIHASGLLLSRDPMIESVPMELSDSNEIVSAYDMEVSLTVHCKLDILGLRTLDVIQETAKQININIYDIDVNHESIYKFLQFSDKFYGLFQIEDGLTKQAVTKVKPKNLDQLAACISISRPGAYKNIDDYVTYCHTGQRKLIHPAIDGELESTGGILLYQETINDICMRVYGLDPTSSDEIRRAISKKVRLDMAKWEPILYECGEKKGIDKSVTKWFWDTCNASADYLFAKNHCLAYSYISAYTIYLKANYPLQFFLASLKLAQYETDPMLCIANIQNEMRLFGFKLLPPSIYNNENDYSILDKNILMGMSAIKGISEKALEKLALFDKTASNKFSLFEAAQTAKIPINIMTALIMSGCLPPTNNETRSHLVLECETYGLLTDREKIFIHRLGPDSNYDLLNIIKDCTEKHKDEKGKPLIKESRYGTIKRDYNEYKEKYIRNSKHEELCAYVMESEYLGFSYTSSLRTIYSKTCIELCNFGEIAAMVDGSYVRVAARVVEIESRVSREKKKPYVRMTLKDETGQRVAMLFGEQAIGEMTKFNKREVKAGDIVVVNGKTKGDSMFVNSCAIQDNPIIVKKSDLKKEENFTI